MKILIVRFSSIGDIVLTSPVSRLLKKQLNAEVHFLTKDKYVSLIDNSPYLDKIYSIEKNIDEVAGILKSEKYDYIIDLHNNLRARILKYKLKIKSKVVDKRNWDKWLMVNIKKKITIPHIVDRYIQTVEKLGCYNDGKGLDFFYKMDQTLFSKYKIPNSYICVSLGAMHFTKKIPVDILLQILAKTKNKIVLIGGRDVMEEAKILEKEINLINMVGKISISQSAQIIEYSQKILTSDTGMMHIAAALKKKIIVLWGNTVPEFGMHPYYGNLSIEYTNFEVNDLNCRPCSKIGFDKCPKGHFKCMKNQSISNISNALNR